MPCYVDLVPVFSPIIKINARRRLLGAEDITICQHTDVDVKGGNFPVVVALEHYMVGGGWKGDNVNTMMEWICETHSSARWSIDVLQRPLADDGIEIVAGENLQYPERHYAVLGFGFEDPNLAIEFKLLFGS